MELDRDTLNRFVDGELAPQEMASTAEILAQRPDLEAYVLGQERLRDELRAGFRELDRAVPERLISTIRSAPVSWQWRWRARLRPGLFFPLLAPAGTALVVGLVLGLVARPQSDLDAKASGQLVAQGGLGRTLDRRLAREGDGSGPVRIGISFRNKTGEDCRTFTDGENTGLACRTGRTWIVETLARQAAEDKGAAYRMAGSDMPDPVRQAVSASIVGAPFDDAEEMQARARSWSGQ